MAKLFVSHSSLDVPVVSPFVELLERGVGIPPGDICTSLKGQGVKPGTEFKESIRTNLRDAACAVTLISENYYASGFSMCELGGVWLQVKSFLPVLVPPLGFDSLRAILQGLHVLKLDDATDLDQLLDELRDRLSLGQASTPRWTKQRDRFLQELPEALKQIPPSATVARELNRDPAGSRASSNEKPDTRSSARCTPTTAASRRTRVSSLSICSRRTATLSWDGSQDTTVGQPRRNHVAVVERGIRRSGKRFGLRVR